MCESEQITYSNERNEVMKKIISVLLMVTILFTVFPENTYAIGLSCPVMRGTFSETKLDISIMSNLDTTVSGYVTDYKSTRYFGPIYLGKEGIKHLTLSYNLKNTKGMLAKFYFTQITPLLRERQ